MTPHLKGLDKINGIEPSTSTQYKMAAHFRACL